MTKNMKNMTLANIAKAVNGSLHNAEQHVGEEAAGVVLDSRKVEAGYVLLLQKASVWMVTPLSMLSLKKAHLV